MAEATARDCHNDAVEAAFEAALDALFSCKPAAIAGRRLISAVSGGPDSMCLAVLAADYATRHRLDHRAIIIDHGIRANSAAEAARVRLRLSGMGIPAEVITVDAPAPETGIQAWARTARYAHLLQAARRDRAALLLGHHRDDQAETVMMRLLRSSGLAGLAAMRAVTFREDVPLLRPLLGLDGGALRHFCMARGIVFETDPSNRDRRFERVRLRQWLAGETAVTRRDLLRLSDAAARIDDMLVAAFRRHGMLPRPRPGGHMFLSAAALGLPDEILSRLLSHIVGQMTAAEHPPAQKALRRLAARLRAGSASTLGGARFTRHQEGLLVTAEDGRRPLRVPVAAGGCVIFAGRWRVTSPVAAIVRRLGESGSGADAPWRESRGWQDLPPLARRSVPALETLDGTLRYPHLSTDALSCTSPGEAVAEYLPHSLDREEHMMATSDLKQAAGGTTWPAAVKPV